MAKLVWRLSPELLWTLVAHDADGILVVGNDGNIWFVNEAAKFLFDRTTEQLIGHPFGHPVAGQDNIEVTIFSKGQQHLAQMRVIDVYWQADPAHLVSLRLIPTSIPMVPPRPDSITNSISNALNPPCSPA
jgi:PAS domain-containing protein